MKLHYYESILNFYCDSLTEEELRRIDENLRQIPIMGDRYPAAYAKRVGL